MGTKILNTTKNEIVELTIIDPKTGLDWSKDLIGNLAVEKYEVPEDREDDADYAMNHDDLFWWTAFVENYDKMQDAIEIAREVLDDDVIQQCKNHFGDNDCEYGPAKVVSALIDSLNEIDAQDEIEVLERILSCFKPYYYEKLSALEILPEYNRLAKTPIDVYNNSAIDELQYEINRAENGTIEIPSYATKSGNPELVWIVD